MWAYGPYVGQIISYSDRMEAYAVVWRFVATGESCRHITASVQGTFSALSSVTMMYTFARASHPLLRPAGSQQPGLAIETSRCCRSKSDSLTGRMQVVCRSYGSYGIEQNLHRMSYDHTTYDMFISYDSGLPYWSKTSFAIAILLLAVPLQATKLQQADKAFS
jgi:hypothetical protein